MFTPGAEARCVGGLKAKAEALAYPDATDALAYQEATEALAYPEAKKRPTVVGL